ncbi:PilN domain-containing protein [Pontiella agarivorans]|uniref:PilN domain-containing protein n=1 Tax=Pontiella agarivorans TaxID=3038953 RepID=A0ABU5MWJ7_9BACT|nr:PilN domain-containing protein [Pontiella agarivorans]MDZ8118560.1 PilN domain-containing protein [Pontiella agarivorans]
MSAKTTMCILFGDQTVDVAFVDRSMLGTQVRFVERFPRNEQLFETLAERMKAEEKTPARVTLCIPRNTVIQRTLHYPAAARDELENMIRFEAVRHIPLPEEERLMGWSTADSPDGQQVVLNLTAARRADVRDLIDQFEQAGVPIDEAVAFSSAVSSTLSDIPTMLVLADAEHMELCLYGEDILQDSQLLSRSMPGFGPQRVVTAARQMAAKNKSWLGDEGISRILTGGAESAEELEMELATAFGLHVQPLEIPEAEATALRDDQEPLAEVLLGASVVPEVTLNLIEDKKRKVPISRRTLVISALCILLGVELAAAYALKSGSPWLQRKRVAQEIQEMNRATADIQEMRTQNWIFRKQLIQLERVCESRTSTMEMLSALSEALPEDTYLNGFSYDGEQLTLKGNSKEPDKLPELVMALPFVDTLNTSDIGRKEGDYHEFELSVSLRR